MIQLLLLLLRLLLCCTYLCTRVSCIILLYIHIYGVSHHSTDQNAERGVILLLLHLLLSHQNARIIYSCTYLLYVPSCVRRPNNSVCNVLINSSAFVRLEPSTLCAWSVVCCVTDAEDLMLHLLLFVQYICNIIRSSAAALLLVVLLCALYSSSMMGRRTFVCHHVLRMDMIP